MCKAWIFLCVLLAGNAGSLLSQTDTEFWFVAPEISLNHGDRPIKLGLSAEDQAATVEIYLPARPDFPHIFTDVPPFTLKEVDLTAYIDVLENFPENTVHDKGVHIRSSSPISAYYQVERTVNQDIFTLKGRQALGTEFFIPSQNDFPNIHNEAAVDMVATQDGTIIIIEPRKPLKNQRNGRISVELNRGETYSIRAAGILGANHLEGTYIRSNKPIAVTNSDDSIVNQDGTGWDLVGDQIVPVELLGTEYIVVRGDATTEIVYITATADDTEIVYSNPTETLRSMNRGQTVSIPITDAALYLNSNKPVYVWHLTGIRNEPAGALIPPVNCTGAQRVNFIRPGGNNFQLVLLTEAQHADEFVLNGDPNLVREDDFSPVRGTDGRWVSAKINLAFRLSRGAHQLINNSGRFHLGVLGDSGPGGCSYGYFSGYSSLFIGEDRSFCFGETVTLDAGENKLSYLWSDGSEGQTIRIDTTGTYWVETTIPGCTLYDTINLEAINIQLDLGEDTTLCEGEMLQLDASFPDASYLWSDDSRNATLMVDQAGTYEVVVSVEECVKQDEIEINFMEVPDINLGPDTLLCEDEEIILDAFLPGATYLWQDSTTASTIDVNSPGNYSVERNFEGCVQKDSLSVIPTFPDIDLGRDTTLCLGDSLPLFFDVEGVSFMWDDGSNEFDRILMEEGIYTLNVFNRCQSFDDTLRLNYVDCTCQLFIGNVFTPNADGVNDNFAPAFNCTLGTYNFQVFDRWGNQVFETSAQGETWDGRDSNNGEYQEGVYYWKLRYKGNDRWNQETIVKQGYVTLLKQL